jgi:hypothetical protein
MHFFDMVRVHDKYFKTRINLVIRTMDEVAENLHVEFNNLIALRKMVERLYRRNMSNRLRLQALRLEIFDSLVSYADVLRTQTMASDRKAECYERLLTFARALELE